MPTRKRYERQSVLVDEVALQRAEQECLADADARALRQQREAETNYDELLFQGCERRVAGVLDEFKSELIIADNLYELDGDFFGIEELPDEQIQSLAEQVALKIAGRLKSACSRE